FFLTNRTGAPQGKELGLIKPLSDNSFSYSDKSFIPEGASRQGACATGAAPVHEMVFSQDSFASLLPLLRRINVLFPDGTNDLFVTTMTAWYLAN
nr:hypothetical protein [Tanacetum cinerariifolium]